MSEQAKRILAALYAVPIEHQSEEARIAAIDAALAPPAQTQQGLSEDETLRKLRGEPASSDRWLASLPAPSNLEKQPSPAAATAQLSEDAREQNEQALRALKDGAYHERNQCVALILRMALALGWRAGIGRHEDKPGENWEDDWRTLVSVDLPTGQASWHFHDSEVGMLAGLPAYDGKWDGHDTPEKYRRVCAALAGQPAPTEDRAALRAAALEDALRGAKAHIEGTLFDMNPADHPDELLAEIERALAGSPAQRARPSGEVNEHKDLDFVLVRINQKSVATHRELVCSFCGCAEFTIALSDNGQWNLECASCGETAAILTEVLAKLR